MVQNVLGTIKNVHAGRGAQPPQAALKDIGDLTLRFTPGANPAQRHVVIGGASKGPDGSPEDVHLTLKNGVLNSFQSDDGQYHIEARGQNLTINGQKIDLTGANAFSHIGESQAVEANRPTTQNKAFEQLQRRFPGVTFDNPEYAKLANIGPKARIEPGARIELSPKLEIRGPKARVGAGAHVKGDASIYNSTVLGTVSGGRLEGSKVEKNAHVSGGELKGSTVGSGSAVSGGKLDKVLVRDSRVRGGQLDNTKVLNGSEVTDGVLSKMVVENGSKVTGGYLENFKLNDQDVSGGGHFKGLNPMWSEEAKENVRTDAFSGIRDQAAQAFGYNPGLYNVDYAAMNNTYDPNMLGYGNMNGYGGYQMPQGLYGNPQQYNPQQQYNPGIVAAPNPYGGMGTGAMLGLGAGAMLGMGMGGFGLGMYGLGFGGLGMMGMMGMGGLGLGGFNWLAW